MTKKERLNLITESIIGAATEPVLVSGMHPILFIFKKQIISDDENGK